MNSRSLIVTVIVCATALMIASLVANAGPLSPPAGPVAPTNKTLAEVEPRIAINATNTPGDANSLFRIVAPGSYYLTGNIAGVVGKHGIEIASSGVTLDLMGFELLGVPGSLDGINVSVFSLSSIRIHNGSPRNWGGAGVDAGNASNASLRNLRAEGNGGTGLQIGRGGLIESCTVRSNGSAGILTSFDSTLSGNTATSNTGDGIFANFGSMVSGNTANFNGAAGIFANSGSMVSGNTVHANTGAGISANTGCTISGNTASFNTGDGIRVSSDCLVLNNNCDSNGFGTGDGAGIHTTSNDTRIEDNNVTNNDRGIEVNFSGNLIIRNSAAGNGVAYDIAANNRYGPIINITASGTPAVNGNSAATTVGTTNPWANFSY